MLMKVYGGTNVQQGEGLCDTCRHARIIRGRRTDDEVVVCGAIFVQPLRITFKVVSCSEHIDSREPGYHELFDKAWILRPASKRRPAGFVHSSDLKDDERREVLRETMDAD